MQVFGYYMMSAGFRTSFQDFELSIIGGDGVSVTQGPHRARKRHSGEDLLLAHIYPIYYGLRF